MKCFRNVLFCLLLVSTFSGNGYGQSIKKSGSFPRLALGAGVGLELTGAYNVRAGTHDLYSFIPIPLGFVLPSLHANWFFQDFFSWDGELRMGLFQHTIFTAEVGTSFSFYVGRGHHKFILSPGASLGHMNAFHTWSIVYQGFLRLGYEYRPRKGSVYRLLFRMAAGYAPFDGPVPAGQAPAPHQVESFNPWSMGINLQVMRFGL